MLKKIKAKGTGGHGIKLLMSSLAKIISKEYNITLVFDYDSAVRGGFIDGNLLFSTKKINSPIFQKTDLLVDLVNNKIEENNNETNIDLEEYKKKSPNLISNMFYLGIILKRINKELLESEVKEVLGKKFSPNNFESIKFGYNLM